MKWNTHQDMENRAYSGILTSLFPEQTKTIPRIIVWSIIFLLDLIAIIGGAFRLGLVSFGSKIGTVLLLAAVVGVFWLQGFLWTGAMKFFRNRRDPDGRDENRRGPDLDR